MPALFSDLSKNIHTAANEYKQKQQTPPASQPAAVPPRTPAPPRPTLGAVPTLQKTAIDRLILDRTGVDKQYEANRQRANQTENAAVQNQRDAIARRAAALGGAPGGAFIKQEQLAMGDSAQRLSQANLEIDAAKDAELRRMAELETQLNAQREDAQAMRDMEKWKTDLSTSLTKYGMDDEAWRWEQDYALRERQQDKLEEQMDIENEEGLRVNVLSSLFNSKAYNFTPEQAGAILSALGYDFEDLGINEQEFFGIEGVTKNAPPPQVKSGPAMKGDQPVGKTQRVPGTTNQYIDENGTRFIYKNNTMTRMGA